MVIELFAATDRVLVVARLCVTTICCIILLFSSKHASGQGSSQSVIKIVDVNTRSNAVHETLPFDIPVLLKYTLSEPLNIRYVGLVQIERTHIKDYLDNILISGDRFSGIDTREYKYSRLQYKIVANLSGDSKYELIVSLPALKPNKFYDITVLRWPNTAEAKLYYQLFNIYYQNGNIIDQPFLDKLREINRIKAPFEHLIVTGPGTGLPDTGPLTTLYNSRLRPLFVS